MPAYIYKALDSSGKMIKGMIEAENERLVVEKLRNQDYIIVDIKEKMLTNFRIALPFLGERVGSKDLAVFCRQMSTLMNAGIHIVDCINTLQEQSTNEFMKKSLQKIAEHLKDGNSLSFALGQFPKIFPIIFVNMLETGEISGTIDEVMDRLAINYEREHAIKEKIRSAMIYPVVVLITAIVAVNIMLIFIIPILVNMFLESGANLPLPTQIVLGLSNAVKYYWWIFLLIFIVLYFGIKQIFYVKGVREFYDRILLRLPVFGELNRTMIISRFARSLGTLIRSGVPLVESLDTVRGAVENVLVSSEINLSKASILQGKGIATPLKGSHIFPPMVVNMIFIGEESGALDSMLEKIGIFYDRELDDRLERLSSMMEPFLILGLGLILGFIIVAMMLPILDLSSGAFI